MRNRSPSSEEIFHERKHKEKKHKKSDKKSRHSSPSLKKKKKKSKHSKSSSLEKSLDVNLELSMSPQLQIRRPSPDRSFHEKEFEHRKLYHEDTWRGSDRFTPQRSLSPRRNGSPLIPTYCSRSPGSENEVLGRRASPRLSHRLIESPHTPPLPPKAYENSKLDNRHIPPSPKRSPSPMNVRRRYLKFSLYYFCN